MDDICSKLKDCTLESKRPIPKQSCLCSVAVLEEKVTTDKKYPKHFFGHLLGLAIRNNHHLEEVLSYELDAIPWSLATPDGLPRKTNKAVLLHELEKEFFISERPEVSAYIIDAGGMIQSLSSFSKTYGDLCQMIFNYLPKSNRIDFVCDEYRTYSIKSIERKRRGMGKYMTITGPSQQTPPDFKEFLSNNRNKIQLYDMIIEEWKTDKYASRFRGRQLIVTHREKCYKLVSDGRKVQTEEVEELFSNQEEADTRMLLHVKNASLQNEAVIIRSPDTDVFLLLLAFGNSFDAPVYMETGTSKRRRILDIGKIRADIGDNASEALLGFHAFTGCDTTSAFMRKGKQRSLKLMLEDDRYINLFKDLGKEQFVTDDVIDALEEFTCLMYGYKRTKKYTSTINNCRYKKFIEKYPPNKVSLNGQVAVDLSTLPPCYSSLLLHIKRCNYQTNIWRRSLDPNPNLPCPLQHGWVSRDDGGLGYKWTDRGKMPSYLESLLSKNPFNFEDDIEIAKEFGAIALSDADTQSTEILGPL